MSQSSRRRHNQAAQARSTAGVCVGYCHPHHIDAGFNTSLMTMLVYDGHHEGHVIPNGEVIDFGSGPRVAAARNSITQAFLQHPLAPEWLFMVDADMVFPPDILEQFLKVADPIERPVVGGLCFIGGRGAKVEPTMRILVEPPAETPDALIFDTVWEYPLDALCKVDQTGAAALFIHRSVIEKMGERYGEPSPWFAETHSQDASGVVREFGEDVTFCLRLRSMDIPLYVHTGIKFGHIKPSVIDEESYLEYRRGISEHGEDVWQYRHLKRMGLVGNAIVNEKSFEHFAEEADRTYEMSE